MKAFPAGKILSCAPTVSATAPSTTCKTFLIASAPAKSRPLPSKPASLPPAPAKLPTWPTAAAAKSPGLQSHNPIRITSRNSAPESRICSPSCKGNDACRWSVVASSTIKTQRLVQRNHDFLVFLGDERTPGNCHHPVWFGRRRSPGLERSEEHTSELQSRVDLVCRLLLEKKKKKK